MPDDRPNPDALLSRLASEEHSHDRGRLKVFFGANAGVGKTYAMLEAAQARRREGGKALVGLVETHGRGETEALLDGLEILPRRSIEHRGMTLHEFDLDAALACKPALILVDELAHTNAPGTRYEKRWQDVAELLDAGIDVYTALNVQHLESLNDVVEQITGVKVRETVPDQVVERADEIVLVDLPPQELLQRLREGKVYMGAQAARAAENFFQTGNLLALRELALRFVAKRVNVDVQIYRDAESVRRTWPTQERLLVAVGPSPSSAKLIRATRRLASNLGAEWIALSVQTARAVSGPPEARERVAEHLRLAQSLGAEIVTVGGDDVSGEILRMARDRNVTKIVAGKPVLPRWREWFSPSPIDRLIRESGDIDVYVIRGEGETHGLGVHPVRRRIRARRPYLAALGCVAASSAIAWAMFPFFALSDLIMVYLAGIAATAMFASRGATLLASALSVLAFNILFVPPRFTIDVESPHYLLTFSVMFVVATLISSLALRLREQADAARESERRTVILHRLSRRLAAARGVDNIMAAALEEIAVAFNTEALAFIRDGEGHATFLSGHPVAVAPSEKERAVAQWTLDNAKPAGAGTGTLGSALLTHVPIRVADQPPIAAMAVVPPSSQGRFFPDQMQLLEALCGQAALALEVDRLEEQHRLAEVQAETERLRSSVLSSVSHDLRTPLASIVGCAGSLLDDTGQLAPATHRELLRTINDEADRMGGLITNLLEMTRLEADGLELHRVAMPIDELIGSALAALERRLASRPVEVDLPADLPFVSADEILMQHVLLNLLENAIKYAPPGSPITIVARQQHDDVVLEIADRGPGLAPGEETLIFEKFKRGRAGLTVGGVGLGLAICKGIVAAHGGRIWATNREDGGASFFVAIPAARDLDLALEESPE